MIDTARLQVRLRLSSRIGEHAADQIPGTPRLFADRCR
jgi:hypothetical protein